MTYDINPPIKSNAASISFWLFTTKDINEAEPPEVPNPNIYHITLEDFFVVTIIPGKSDYVIYATAYEMYHKAYGTVLKDKTTKKEFEEVMTNYFPYKKWHTSASINKINRWVNIIISYNKNLLRILLQYNQNHLHIRLLKHQFLSELPLQLSVYSHHNSTYSFTFNGKHF